MYKYTVAGIDPGVKGAIAVSYADGHWEVFDCPSVKVKASSSKTRTESDYLGMRNILETLPPDTKVFLEHVWGYKGQGGSSQFCFGDNFGAWRMGIAFVELSMVKVAPAKWKKKMAVTSDKKRSLVQARELVPSLYDFLSRVKDADRAEAILLALYGRRVLGDG